LPEVIDLHDEYPTQTTATIILFHPLPRGGKTRTENSVVSLVSTAMDTYLVPTGQKAWMIEGAGGCLGELRRIRGLYVIIPSRGSLLDDVKGGYGSQSAAMNAIIERTGGVCKMKAH